MSQAEKRRQSRKFARVISMVRQDRLMGSKNVSES
jgi:hypothetical protein